MQKLNLIVIGASKCGTTFVHDVLRQHPDICMSLIKEPYYFLSDAALQAMELDQKKHFPCTERRYLGESTPAYSETTQFPEVPQRIFRYNPDAKLILLVREPFARLQSVFTQTLSTGHWVDEERFARYGRAMPLSFRDAVFSYPPMLDACKYWTHLQNYRKYFADSSIKVVFFDELEAQTEQTARSIFRFLGVDDKVSVDYGSANRNEGFGKKIFNPWRRRFRRILPKSVRQIVPGSVRRYGEGLIRIFIERKVDRSHLTPEQHEQVRSMLLPEVQGIYQYLGIEDDPWGFFGNAAVQSRFGAQGK